MKTSGNYDRTEMELQIERIGDELRIRPTRKSLAGVMERFARFSPDFLVQGRGEHEQQERDPLRS